MSAECWEAYLERTGIGSGNNEKYLGTHANSTNLLKSVEGLATFSLITMGAIARRPFLGPAPQF